MRVCVCFETTLASVSEEKPACSQRCDAKVFNENLIWTPSGISLFLQRCAFISVWTTLRLHSLNASPRTVLLLINQADAQWGLTHTQQVCSQTYRHRERFVSWQGRRNTVSECNVTYVCTANGLKWRSLSFIRYFFGLAQLVSTHIPLNGIKNFPFYASVWTWAFCPCSHTAKATVTPWPLFHHCW